MKKIEIIWREILENHKDKLFEQKILAHEYGFSTSTVFAAISSLRQIGAVEVTARFFRITNLEKILLFWATHRNLVRDIIYTTYFPASVMEIEGLVDNESIFGGFSAGRFLLGQAPSDYDKVYLYVSNLNQLRQRFPKKDGPPNIFILKADPFLSKFGQTTCPSQTFVDLWNMKEWYAADFMNAIKEKYYGFLP